MTFESKTIEVTYEEMKQIIRLESLNQKLIAYCLLIHSKRFANQQGVFYMSFNQMSIASGLSDKTVRTIVNKLEEIGIINVIARNQILKDSRGAFAGKRPNKYKINIEEVVSKALCEIKIERINYIASLKLVINSLFDLSELKNVLPRRQYEKLRATEIYK